MVRLFSLGRARPFAVQGALACFYLALLSFPRLRADEPSPAAAKADEAATTAVSSKEAPADHARISKLIKDLGSTHYATRRTAATELRQIGPEAFDLLHAATEDADPEIAASANYLLRQIAVRWVQPDDPLTVREVMQKYDKDNEATRLQHVEQLIGLANGAG